MTFGHWPPLDPLRVVDSRPDGPHVVDTKPGELAFLELIGRPNDAPPEGTTVAGIIDLVRFLLRAAMLPEDDDGDRLRRMREVLQGGPEDRQLARQVRDYLRDHALPKFWPQLMYGYQEGASNSKARQVEGMSHMHIELARRAMAARGVDPGPPPESWTPGQATAVYSLMVKLDKLLRDTGRADLSKVPHHDELFNLLRQYNASAVREERGSLAALEPDAEVQLQRPTRKGGRGKVNVDELTGRVLELARVAKAGTVKQWLKRDRRRGTK